MKFKRISFYAPVEVHQGFKIWCAKQGATMKTVLLEVVNKIYKAEVLKKIKRRPTMTSAITAMHLEIDKLDLAIQACQDSSGCVYNWCKYRMTELVRQKEAFRESIRWMETQVHQTRTGAPCPECGVPMEKSNGTEGCCVVGCNAGIPGGGKNQ